MLAQRGLDVIHESIQYCFGHLYATQMKKRKTGLTFGIQMKCSVESMQSSLSMGVVDQEGQTLDTQFNANEHKHGEKGSFKNLNDEVYLERDRD